MDHAAFGSPRPVVVGGVYAHCTGCGCAQFLRMRRDPRQKVDSVLCAQCGIEHQYIGLLRQILEAVNESSEKLRREAVEIRRQRHAAKTR
jgi:Zn ribbon nucleic-acid-binding protein